MSATWEIHIFENRKPVFNVSFIGTMELGRQDRGESPPYTVRIVENASRLVMASLEEDRIPRKYVRIEAKANGTVTLTNLSQRVPLKLEQGPPLKPDGEVTLSPPVTLLIEQRAIRIQPATDVDIDLHSLPQATMAPFQDVSLKGDIASFLTEGAMSVEGMGRWLHAAMGVLQSATGSSDFYQRAARAVVDLVGLDSCRVLLRDHGSWKEQALQTAADAGGLSSIQPSRNILERILQDKRTFWELPGQTFAGSLVGVKALVAAPILDRQGEVIGVLYGERSTMANQMRVITQLEALLVELLANGVAAGLARVEQEQVALRTRVQFEQFFTPELSRQLLARPELLEGREEEVTILFCDIRGFSRISERLGPQRTIEWTGDVLGALSECVLGEHGVLVDYVGDELMAMWGAPDRQQDHAARAVRAALSMLALVPALNERWRRELDEPVCVTLGVNTGTACVGNVGSHCKFKYGPLGTPVNLASRVQGANKFWKTSLLVTHHTQSQLGDDFTTRRLGQVRVVNIGGPVTLYEVVIPGHPRGPALKESYETALAHFEKKEFRHAVRVLGNLLPEYPEDGPAFVLMTRAVQCLVEEPEAFDAVWKLPGK